MKFELMNKALSLTDENGKIELVAPKATDFFIDIFSEYKKLNAPLYAAAVEGDFIFRCSVRPKFGNIYDAGCLMAYESEEKWIKLAFENTDLGYPAVVSVVTNGCSDDCNGERIDNDEIRLQIVRKGSNWCLHYAVDESGWKMVRYFKLEMSGQIKIGVSAQSPLGENCRVAFNELEISPNTYRNIRKAI
jgi:uncharacterized protein